MNLRLKFWSTLQAVVADDLQPLVDALSSPGSPQNPVHFLQQQIRFRSLALRKTSIRTSLFFMVFVMPFSLHKFDILSYKYYFSPYTKSIAVSVCQSIIVFQGCLPRRLPFAFISADINKCFFFINKITLFLITLFKNSCIVNWFRLKPNHLNDSINTNSVLLFMLILIF